MDRMTFELFLLKTMPERLLLVCGAKKTSHLVSFCAKNRLPVKIERVSGNSFALCTNTAVKHVFLEQAKLSLQRVLGYEVARVAGTVSLSHVDGEIFDELRLQQVTDPKAPSLFLVPKNYKLQELQSFLVSQCNLPTVLSDAELCFKDKVRVSLREGQIHLEGTLCPEYFTIRKLIYCHLGRM